MDSPEQGLLVVPIFSDILPQSGGTTIATDSIQVLARFLAQRPEGLHPDGTQGGGYLIPALVEQCQQFEELTGNAGDVALLHPLMLHRASANPSGRARFIQNGRLSLEEPLCFNRADPADYSLVEICVLRALGEAERLAGWEPNGPRENNDKSTDWGRVTPRPFRTEEEKVEQQAIITVEQEKLAVGVPPSRLLVARHLTCLRVSKRPKAITPRNGPRETTWTSLEKDRTQMTRTGNRGLPFFSGGTALEKSGQRLRRGRLQSYRQF